MVFPLRGSHKKSSGLSFHDEFVSALRVMEVLTFGPRIDIYAGPVASAPLVLPRMHEVLEGQLAVAIDELSEHTPPEKTRRGGRPKREAMTLTGLHQKFLLHCEVERQLSPQTIVSYRSDFEQFKESLRTHGRFGLARQDAVATFSVQAVRDYQYDMVARGWGRATCRRRLIQLNRFGTWLVKREHLKKNPLAEIEVPRREKRLPRVLAWSVAEQVVAGESRARNRAILAVLVCAGLRRGEVARLDVGSLQREGDVALRVRGKGNKECVVGPPKQAVTAIEAYLATRPGAQPEGQCFS
jgi:site-specific recombinase XerD